MQSPPQRGRRAFLKASALSAVAITPAFRAASADTGATRPDEAFSYEVTRTKEEWKARLNDKEYEILRRGGTELPNSHEYAGEMPEGTYACRGCDLTLYDSIWKVVLDAGYVFFKYSRENAILTGVDETPPYGAADKDGARDAMIEVHCRRCGSHMGHILLVQGQVLNCINGTSLAFTAATA